jgi:two-component system, sensor histidine kinase and response regulator
MSLNQLFDPAEHDEIVMDCFLQMWKHSADLMFIMALEEDGTFSLFDNNPASRKVMGLDESVNVHRLDIMPMFGENVANELYQTYREVIQNKTPISKEQQNIRMDGSSIYFDTLFVPIFNNKGEPRFVCGVTRDISKIKEAEKVAIKANEKLKEYSYALEEINQNLDAKVKERTLELEKSKKVAEEALMAKSSFVARMSHEIRTPINAVIGLSDLILKTNLNRYQEDFIRKILDSGEVLLDIVNDVLDFSKMEAGKLVIEKIAFSVEKTVHRVINMNAIKAGEKTLELICHIDPKVPAILIGDPLRIQQILVNLISNAIKFTEKGQVCLTVQCEERTFQEVILIFYVSDTGIGISKEQSCHLFQSFNQADTSITRKYGGTGLGLSISNQLCELMGGNIHLESELGKGTTFTVSLPLSTHLQQVSQERRRKPFRHVARVPDLSKFRVLVVDDHLINTHVAIGYLEETGVAIDTATNGLAALSKIENTQYDLILLDIQMPEMDGFTVAKKVRNELRLENVPIIAMTAHVNEEAIETSYLNGMNDHIGKPIDKRVLYEKLHHHLLSRSNHDLNFTPTSVEARIKLAQYPLDKVDERDTTILSDMSLIEWFDVERGVQNMGNLPLLYLDVVHFFFKQYNQQLDALFKLKMAKDKHEILEFAHALKSGSAYVGAFELSFSCAKLEDEIRNNSGSDAFFIAVLYSLQRHIEGLRSVFPEWPSLNVIDKSDCIESNSLQIQKVLVQLLPLLKNSDFAAEHYFDTLHSLVANTEYVSQVGELVWNVEEVEYERAAIIAQDLLDKMQGIDP